MANILYGVNGEGSGHSTRAREVITHLLQRGHQVHVVSFDRGLRNLQADFEVTEVDGWRLEYVRNRVRYRKTLVKNLLKAPRAARSSQRLLRLAREWNIDLVCTDFEPLSCHVGHKLGLPVIAIDNQHILIYGDISYPRRYRREATTAKLVTRVMTPRADAYLMISFFTPPVRNRRAFVFPPILRKEVLDTKSAEQDYVLVYLTAPSSELAGVLRRVRSRFICYGFDRQGESGNLIFKKPSLPGFLHDLANCKAVVGNCGFSLISEALYLHKPYLAWPVAKQFEQEFNAFYIDKMGYGAYWDELNKERIDSFLFNLDLYRANLASYPVHDNSALFAKLDALIANL